MPSRTLGVSPKTFRKVRFTYPRSSEVSPNVALGYVGLRYMQVRPPSVGETRAILCCRVDRPRCDGHRPVCEMCTSRGTVCTWAQQQKKRGPKAKRIRNDEGDHPVDESSVDPMLITTFKHIVSGYENNGKLFFEALG